MGRDKKKPEGGVDHSTLQPTDGPTYTLRVVFHSASDLSIGDIATGSSDPYILAQCNGPQRTRHKVDPPLRFRSATSRRTLNPKWEAEWVIAGVPASGCELKIRVYDEDNGGDDLLGRLHLHTGPLSESYSKPRQVYELTKRGSSLHTLGLRHCMMLFSHDVRKEMKLVVSLEVLGRTKVEVGKCYTVNSFWWTHYSPILGRVVNTTTPDEKGEQANFQANQLQLVGPVPNELYHRYVSFNLIMPWMFERKGLRGRLLHAALHQQHEEVYHFDAESEYGRLAGPGKAMAQRFLDMTHWGEGNRIFTYVITLDGLMRFTETGPEFGIDMLSKHTMHSDVNIYIAFSGEFFVRKYRPNAPGERVAAGHERDSLDIEIEDVPASRTASSGEKGDSAVEEGLEVRPRKRGPDDSGKAPRLRQRHRRAREAQCDTPPEEDTLHGPDTRGRSTNPADYELVIDNDSGTYRPDKGLLPVLAKFLRLQFGELHVAVLSCDDDVDQQIKKKRLKAKAKAQAKSGKRILYRQSSSSSSLSSSDEEDFEAGRAHHSGKEKGVDFISDPGAFLKERYSHRKDKVRGHLKKAKGGEEGEEDKSEAANSGDESIDTADVVDTPDGTTNPGTPRDALNESAADPSASANPSSAPTSDPTASRDNPSGDTPSHDTSKA